jgi:transcriptional regulator with XRE-family HTH domain
MVQIPRLREWRELQGWTQKDLAQESGVSPRSIAGYEAGASARPGTTRKLAEALDVEVADLVLASGKELAPPSAEQRSFNNHLLEEEQRTEWDAAVRSAHQLREHGQERVGELLAAWQESKDREGDPTERRPYLDDIGEILQEAYDAETALLRNFPAEMTPRAREAAEQAGGEWVPDPEWEEVREASRFYGALLAMVQGAGLHVRPDSKPHRVENAA